MDHTKTLMFIFGRLENIIYQYVYMLSIGSVVVANVLIVAEQLYVSPW